MQVKLHEELGCGDGDQGGVAGEGKLSAAGLREVTLESPCGKGRGLVGREVPLQLPATGVVHMGWCTVSPYGKLNRQVGRGAVGDVAHWNAERVWLGQDTWGGHCHREQLPTLDRKRWAGQ